MSYFSRRNNYATEYSGFEEASNALRERIVSVISKYIDTSANYFGDGYSKYWVDWEDFQHEVHKYILHGSPLEIVKTAPFHEVFTVIEIFWDLANELDGGRREEVFAALCQTFMLSGSVYQINPREGRVELVPNEELAKQIKEAETVLQPYADAYKKFFEAVGNLFGRKAKAGDVVRDVYVAAEAYLKAITGEAQYSTAVKKLEKSGAINREQKVVLEQLYAFRSNTQGTTHAGSAPEVDEKQALWFVDTMSAQFRHLDVQAKEGKI